ncbi:MAG: ABC transporter permease [Candidatus Acidiferrales bacterium]|jgi:lipopolysaccharide transport system permease protein
MAIYQNTGVKETVTTKTGSAQELESQSTLRSSLPDKPVVLNEAGDSSPVIYLRELWIYRELLYFLTWRDIKVRYKQTAMGAAWAVIQPLFAMLLFALFFGLWIRVPSDGMPYLVFFYCGLLPWTFFANAVSQSSQSLILNSNLITKVYFPRAIIPAASIGAALVDLLIASVILVGLALYYGLGTTWSVLMLPALVVLAVLFSLGCGICIAALTAKYRDIRHALPFVLQLWMFLTPIIYPLSVVPAKWRWLVLLNPLAGIVEGMRAALVGRGIDWSAISISVVMTFASLVVAAYVFRRIERGLADLI